MNWRKHFDERQLSEIQFCRLYAKDFGHGTDGHNAKLIIAKMSNLLSEIEDELFGEGVLEQRARRAQLVLEDWN